MLELESEDSKLRRKRPERQLYVPPAQRKSSLNESNNFKNKQRQKNNEVFKKEKVTETTQSENKIKNDLDTSGSSDSSVCSDSVNANKSIFEFLLCSYFLQSRWKCLISGTHLKFHTNFGINHYQNEHFAIEHFLLQIPLVLFYSYNTSYLHQDKFGNNEKYFCTNVFPFYTVKKEFQYTYFNQILSKPLLVSDYYNSYLDISKQFYIFCDYDMYKVGDSLFIDNSYKYFPCLHIILEGILLEKNTCIFDITDNISDTSNSIICLSNKNDASASKNTQNEIENLKHVNVKSDNQSILSEKPLRKKMLQEKTDHEEEVEIMKKTKEHINRKTRPIIKYVGESNDTLNIGNDSVKSWEDLFDDKGEFKDELLLVEKLQKSKTNKSKGDSSEFITEDIKHIEELEHMVELYDFPSSFKTQDLIQAFSTIQCDGMYVKWVDNTHAILVLGTLTQAMNATRINNPLIKVRPIAAASKNTLAIAYKNDLKPAMKRPATNLQTARRFITAALGTKIGVSKERMAKEREDLKTAREMKKMMRKNERDAWEGNLQSSLQ